MPINKKESLIYTIIMCCFMVYFMSVYNIMVEMGSVNVEAFVIAWAELPLAVIIAFILDWFIIAGPAKKLAFKLLGDTESTTIKIIVVSCCMICGMVITMSLFGAIKHTGLSMAVFPAWGKNILKNVIMALPLQLIIAGPIVRRLFRKLFPIGTIVVANN